jgi:hypothetical protein
MPQYSSHVTNGVLIIDVGTVRIKINVYPSSNKIRLHFGDNTRQTFSTQHIDTYSVDITNNVITSGFKREEATPDV